MEIEVFQKGWLPLVWLRMQDSLPGTLGVSGVTRQVVSLAPRGKSGLRYQINATRRGYYPIGPLRFASGDPFGISGDYDSVGEPNYLIVYPRVVLLNNFGLPSRSPMGTLKHHLPIYEDPTRVFSKRDYVSGDSLRRIDWKASAVMGKLQVKQYEPSIALETMLLLNLNAQEYEIRARLDATELGIVVAASIANWVVSHRQAVGLHTNGLDPMGGEGDAGLQPAQPLQMEKGHQHLMRLLEELARVEATRQEGQTMPFLEMVHQQRVHLPWGTTLVLITGSVDERLFDEIFQARRSGINPVIILVGNVPGVQAAREKADYFRILFYHVQNQLDLDQWRTAPGGTRPMRTAISSG